MFWINTKTYNTLCRFKLPITISDETRSTEAIAFSYVIEELVEQTTFLTSQNMKIDAYDHVVALYKAIRKTKLFTIGVSATSASVLPIKYVVKIFLDVDPSSISLELQSVQVNLLFLFMYNSIAYIICLFQLYKTTIHGNFRSNLARTHRKIHIT
jgi:hypothetical protein